MGRTGALTPVAKLESVIIERAGDVIPKIIRVKLENRPQGSRKFIIDLHCPECHHKTSKNKNEVVSYCLNYNCPAQIKGRIEHFVSKNALGIEGLGKKIIDTLVNKKIIKNFNRFRSLYLLV